MALGGLALGTAAWVPAAAPLRDSLRSAGFDRRTVRSVASEASAAACGDNGGDGRIKSIHRYPVKSCGGEDLTEVELSRLSPLPGDRRYMWVDSVGKFITQRPREARQGNNGNGVPKLATISCASI